MFPPIAPLERQPHASSAISHRFGTPSALTPSKREILSSAHRNMTYIVRKDVLHPCAVSRICRRSVDNKGLQAGKGASPNMASKVPSA
jgi:hypothetical protein